MASRSHLVARRVLTPLIVLLLAADAAVVVARFDDESAVDPGELVRALDRGEQQTYHARYEATASAGKLKIELWRRPPNFRQRVDADVGGVTATAETLVTGGQATACGVIGAGTWTCTGAQEFRPAEADPVGAATRALAGQQATKRTTTVAGMRAVCYSLRQANTGTSDLCVTPDGIPLSLTSQSLTFQILELARTVEPDAFRIPTR